jgi:hypothetical protein
MVTVASVPRTLVTVPLLCSIERVYAASTRSLALGVRFRGLANSLSMAADAEQQALEETAVQSTARVGNERTRARVLSEQFALTQRAPFLCECADPSCTEIVMLSLVNYERLREYPSRFLLAAGHEDAEADYELVIEAESGYAIVEKVGVAGEEAVRLDTRLQAHRY